MNVEILGASTDSVHSHKAWSASSLGKVEFPILGDTGHQVSKAFNVLIPEKGFTLRGTFIIDPAGKLVASEINDNSIGRSAHELLRKLQAAQYVLEHPEQVCPASWEPGEKTLKPELEMVGKI